MDSNLWDGAGKSRAVEDGGVKRRQSQGITFVRAEEVPSGEAEKGNPQ